MSSSILRGVLFWVILIGGLWLIERYLILSVKNYPDKTVEKIKYVTSNTLEVEVSIWGSSTAEGNINPLILQDSISLGMMNMGLDGTNIDQYFGLYKEYISYSKNTKYVLLVVDIHGGISDREQLFELHKWVPFIKHQNIYDSFLDIDFETTFKAKYIPFYSLFLYDKHTLNYFYKPFSQQLDTIRFEELGHFIKPGQTVAELYASKRLKSFEVNIGSRSLSKLKVACQIALQKDIQPIIVISPCYIKGLNLIQNSSSVLDSLYEIKRQNEAIELWDFADTYMSKEASFFRDNTHMTKPGVREWSSLLGHKLKLLHEN